MGRLVTLCISGCFSKARDVVVTHNPRVSAGPVRLECYGKAWACAPLRNRAASGKRHRLLAPIVSKDKLIEIDLELSAADTVIGADQPLLEVADRAVGQRHHGLG